MQQKFEQRAHMQHITTLKRIPDFKEEHVSSATVFTNYSRSILKNFSGLFINTQLPVYQSLKCTYLTSAGTITANFWYLAPSVGPFSQAHHLTTPNHLGPAPFENRIRLPQHLSFGLTLAKNSESVLWKTVVETVQGESEVNSVPLFELGHFLTNTLEIYLTAPYFLKYQTVWAYKHLHPWRITKFFASSFNAQHL